MAKVARKIEELKDDEVKKLADMERLKKEIADLQNKMKEEYAKYAKQRRKETWGKCYIVKINNCLYYIYVIPNNDKECIKVSGDGITIEKIDLFSEVPRPLWDNRTRLIDYATEISGRQFADFMSNTYIRMRQRVHFNNFKNKFKKV